MGKQKEIGRFEKPGRGYFDRAQVVELMGIAVPVFERNWQKKLIDAKVLVMMGGKWWANGRAFLDWWARYQSAAALRELGIDPDDLNATTTQLERLHKAKADLAELDLAERRRQIVNKADLMHTLLPAAQRLRTAVDVVQREHPAAYQIFDEAYTAAMESAMRVFDEVNKENEGEQ